MGAPVRFQKAVPGTKEKRRGEAPIGAPVRVMGRLFPSAEGTGFAVRLSHRVRRSAPALVGASPPSDGGTSPEATGRPLPRSDGVWLMMMSVDQQRRARSPTKQFATACHAPRMRGIQ